MIAVTRSHGFLPCNEVPNFNTKSRALEHRDWPEVSNGVESYLRFSTYVRSFVQLCSFVTIPGALRMCLQTCYRYKATLMHYVHLSACCDAHTCPLCGQLVIALAYICSGIIRWPSNIRYLLSLSSSFVLHLGSPKQYFLTFPLSDSRLGLCTMPESQDTYRLRLFRNNAS